MRTREASLAELIADLLAEGPLTGFEICRSLQHRHSVPLKGREGALYAALTQIGREGWIVSEKDPATGRWRYMLPVLGDVGPGDVSLGDLNPGEANPGDVGGAAEEDS